MIFIVDIASKDNISLLDNKIKFDLDFDVVSTNTDSFEGCIDSLVDGEKIISSKDMKLLEEHIKETYDISNGQMTSSWIEPIDSLLVIVDVDSYSKEELIELIDNNSNRRIVILKEDNLVSLKGMI